MTVMMMVMMGMGDGDDGDGDDDDVDYTDDGNRQPPRKKARKTKKKGPKSPLAPGVYPSKSGHQRTTDAPQRASKIIGVSVFMATSPMCHCPTEKQKCHPPVHHASRLIR